MNKETTIVLSKPLKLNDVDAPITEVRLREPTIGEMIKVQNLSGMEQNKQIIAAISKVQPLLVDQMAMSDYLKCVTFIFGTFSSENAQE
jgi:hypothetical protein